MTKVSELKGQRIEITDPDHLIAMGKTHAFLAALDAIQQAIDETPTTGLRVALYLLRALEAENRVSVMQDNIRTVVKAGIDLDTVDVMWDGRSHIYAKPKKTEASAAGESK